MPGDLGLLEMLAEIATPIEAAIQVYLSGLCYGDVNISCMQVYLTVQLSLEYIKAHDGSAGEEMVIKYACVPL